MTVRERQDEETAQQHEQPDRQEDGGEPGRDPAGKGKGRYQQLALQPLPSARRGLEPRTPRTEQLPGRHQPESAGAQASDEPRQGGERPGAIAAAVVEQDHLLACPAAARSNDLPHAAAAVPVATIEVAQRDHVSLAGDPLEHTRLRRPHRIGRGGVGRPEQPGAHRGRPGDDVLGGVELEAIAATPGEQRCRRG